MIRQALIHVAALALLLGATAAHAQEPVPVQIDAAELAEGGPLNLFYAWRYHPGDDPRWADPAFDDSELGAGRAASAARRAASRGLAGDRMVSPASAGRSRLLGKPLMIRVGDSRRDHGLSRRGAADGHRGARGCGLAPARGRGWREVVLSPRTDHVLAVRHTISLAGRHARSGNLGFLLVHRDAGCRGAPARGRAGRRTTPAGRASQRVPAFLAAFLALLHLALFLFYPKARENLFYALAMAAWRHPSSSIFVPAGERGLGESWFSASSSRASLATIYFSLLTYYAVRTRAFPRTWIVLRGAGSGVGRTGLSAPGSPSRLDLVSCTSAWWWPRSSGWRRQAARSCGKGTGSCCAASRSCLACIAAADPHRSSASSRRSTPGSLSIC